MNKYTNRTINFAFRTQNLTAEEKRYIVDNYSATNALDLKETLTKKKVRPVVGKMMVELGVDSDYWQGEYDFFKLRNEKVIFEIDVIFEALKKAGITRAFAYENFGALLSSGTDTALYSSGDVDLYADVNQKETIESVMASLGYRPTRDVFDERNIMTEFLKDDGVIRVNFDWIILRRMMFPVTIDIDGVIGWDNLRRYNDTNILLPSKEALLYLCLLRIAVHGFSRSPDVRLYIDVQNAVCTGPDWDTVIAWAKRDRTLTKFVTVAYIAHHLNGVFVPEFVLNLVRNDKYAQRIISICYDSGNRTLRYDPAGLQLLKVEAAADNRSLMGEILTMIFPSKKWLQAFYQKEGDSCLRKYINYYKRLLGR